jgi:O-antigen ligase
MRCSKSNIAIIVLLLIIPFLLGMAPTRSFRIFVWVIAAAILFFLGFTKTDFALVFLIFFMLLSPEFKLGAIQGRTVVLRMDDIFLLVVFLGWLARMAVNKELGLLKATALNKPILIYILICLVATLFGVLRGFAKLNISIFYILKYLEYYLLFFLVTNNLKNNKQVRILVFSIIFVALIISIYACVLHFQGVERVTAPFEEGGEANTLGGYLILIIAVVTGLLLNLPSFKYRIFFIIFLTFAIPAFLFTLSRGSWFSFIPMLIVLIIMTPKGKVVLITATVIVVILAPIIFPRFFYERISYTFSQGRKYEFMGKRVTLEESTAARINVMKYAVNKWVKEPLIGYGIGSTAPVIDSQYARILMEVGLIGSMGFLWIIITIFINALRNLRKLRENNFARGLIAGFIAGLAGLLVHAIAAETFILIRVMEPFWFLTSIVMTLPQTILSESPGKLNG